MIDETLLDDTYAMLETTVKLLHNYWEHMDEFKECEMGVCEKFKLIKDRVEVEGEHV